MTMSNVSHEGGFSGIGLGAMGDMYHLSGTYCLTSLQSPHLELTLPCFGCFRLGLFPSTPCPCFVQWRAEVGTFSLSTGFTLAGAGARSQLSLLKARAAKPKPKEQDRRPVELSLSLNATL